MFLFILESGTLRLRRSDLLTLSRPLRDVHGVTQRKEDRISEVTRRRRGGSKRRETDVASN